MPKDNYSQSYSYSGSGTNSQGNHYCSRDYGSDAANQNSYHYSNNNGSYYYSNSDGSKCTLINPPGGLMRTILCAGRSSSLARSLTPSPCPPAPQTTTAATATRRTPRPTAVAGRRPARARATMLSAFPASRAPLAPGLARVQHFRAVPSVLLLLESGRGVGREPAIS
ncbi:hypothetical protein DMC30DRAFT_43411 [Rhodotorula diobovata]|uniref:Uncharacterized protein n=1 Tax=Rhodotorula diobovata TaxID=5288 RepID=A0A5C5FS85_9BASI|nr:hypothetical protein DMC30DRAFT_43411 [Rhodotorula diobovata]